MKTTKLQEEINKHINGKPSNIKGAFMEYQISLIKEMEKG